MNAGATGRPGPEFPIEGGELGRLMRALDWSKTPVGPLQTWPAALRSAVSLMLPAQVQIVLFWGPQFVAFYNDAYAPTIGNKHPRALGRPAQENWTELWDDLEPLLQKVLRNGETVAAEDRPFRIERQGYLEEVFFDISYSPVRLDDGSVGGVLCIVDETTEKVLAARRQRESEEQFRSFAQAVPNHVWASPPDGRLDWFNDRVYEYSGAKPGDLDGEGWARLVHEDDVAAASAAWAKALASGEPYEVEFRLRNAAGVYRWHLARAQPIRSDAGAVVRWVGTNTDIHDQKALVAELAHVNEYLEDLVAERTRERDRIWNVSQELFVVADLAGVWRNVNPAWRSVLGYAESDIVGRTPEWLQHPDDREASRAETARLASGERTTRFENRLRHKDGSWRWISWTAAPSGDLVYAVGRDVTAEKEAQEALRATEEQLRQAQKMEAVGQLTGGIAHDFNNLLQGIIGSLDRMRSRIEQGRTADAQRFVAAAMASANRAAALTHRLLAFSRRQPLDPKTVDPGRLVQSMEDLLRRTMGERIGIDLILGAGLWPTRCDPNQLESALLNLAINARDAMPDGGRMILETSNTWVDEAYAARQSDVTPGQYVCIGVTDTGVGMSPDVLARAFDPFFTTKPTGQGTGLGLSMVYGFARQSEGFARIYSEPGAGTTVKIYLPRHVGPEDRIEEPAPSADEQHSSRGETVLVVEDEAVVRGLIVDVLGELGYRVLEASDGPSGLRTLQSNRRIDLLVTDIGLPGLNGRQIADAAREMRPGLKVLFMTGYAENAAIATGFLEPGMQMITKPFAVDLLAARVRQMLAG